MNKIIVHKIYEENYNKIADILRKDPSQNLLSNIYFDGGSRGNGGKNAKAGSGVFVEINNMPILELVRPLGHFSNNIAEYFGALTSLEAARRLGLRNINVIGDSELVIKQLKGEYKVKNENFKVLYSRIKELEREVNVNYKHVKREFNKDADRLSNIAMDLVD